MIEKNNKYFMPDLFSAGRFGDTSLSPRNDNRKKETVQRRSNDFGICAVGKMLKQVQHDKEHFRLFRNDAGICASGKMLFKGFLVKQVQHYKISTLFLLFFLFLIPSFSSAQSTRELINDGVDLYKDGKYTDSEVNFKKGKENSEENFAANFNLGDAYYKQQRYEEAVKTFNSALQLAESDNQKSQVHHNMGNSFLKSEKIQEAVDEYKKALKLNPDDEDTKYNLSYALNLLKNKDQQKKQDKNDKNKDQNKDQDKNKDQNKDQNKKDQQNKDQNQDKQDQQKPDQNQTAQNDNTKQQQNKISKKEAERILEALKNNEKDLQKKLRKKTGTVVKTDKDW